MLHYFADVKYKDPNVLGQSFKLTIDSLLKSDEEVPVKVKFLDLKFMYYKKASKLSKKSPTLDLKRLELPLQFETRTRYL